MAIGGIAAVLGPAIQYGLPAAFELVELGLKWAKFFQANPQLTQTEFDAKWAEMQVEYRAATDRHADLQAQGR